MEPLHIATPLIESTPLSAAVGARVFLKMEALQPIGSFKIRGVGRACQLSVRDGAKRLITSSGGNAGLAVAFAGQKLGVAAEVFVPRTTPEWSREVMRREGAKVIEHGASWDDAHAHAVQLAESDPETVYVHPFDDPRLWEGHGTLIHEVAATGPRPDAVVVSVGGGGLMVGVLEGMHEVGWNDVPVVAVETEGTSSLAQSVAAGELVTLDAIESIATTLGARTVAPAALAWTSRHDVVPVVVSDRAAVSACTRFADDHRVLVEPACGAALAVVYDRAEALATRECILVVVCGGAGANRELLAQWVAAVGE